MSTHPHPKVSVISISYNQEKYIRQALDGFVGQQADFQFEVIISDDHSTDSTAEIIKEYADIYPDIIRPVLRKSNVGVQRNLIEAMKLAQGEYIALCEGDDYWTDMHKLQKQVHVLDIHQDYALCFHRTNVIFDGEPKKNYVYPDIRIHETLPLAQLLQQNYIQTNSVLYRRQRYDYPLLDMMPLDWYLHLYHAQFGRIGFIDETMGVYRRHPGGIWWNSLQNIDQIWKKFGEQHLNLYIEILNIFGHTPKYRKIIINHINTLLIEIARVDDKNNTRTFPKLLKNHNEFLSDFVLYINKELIVKQKEAETLHQENSKLNNDNVEKNIEVAQLRQEIHDIKSSWVWKLRTKAVKTLRKRR